MMYKVLLSVGWWHQFNPEQFYKWLQDMQIGDDWEFECKRVEIDSTNDYRGFISFVREEDAIAFRLAFDT